MIPSFINRSILPHRPGIYLFKDSLDNVLYIGKAVDLYSRIASYFSGSQNSAKTAQLVKEISGIETIIVESELEALILEANLIKKYLPTFNVRLTDDKDYLYIALTKEDFTRVITARKNQLTVVKKWFGPFPSSTTVKETLKQLRRIFPWCSNPPKQTYEVSRTRPRRLRACFYYHLGLCPGPCVGKIDVQEYSKLASRFAKFLEGKKEELVSELTAEMRDCSSKMQFEDAQRIKKTIDGINYLTQPNRISKYLENPNFLEDERLQALVQLQKDLTLDKIPARIEAYDVSNIGGRQASGSMVVATHGAIDKSQYRRFKINPLAGRSGKPNDVGMLKEVVSRRLNHPNWPIPQLILVDGGRGQASVIATLCNQKGVKIPVLGLAKRMEWLYPPRGEIIKLPKRSLSLRLLQKIRDESHRFALNYHRKLRGRALGI